MSHDEYWVWIVLSSEAACFQADRLCEDAHRVASDQCMWVSSELKRARSLVRIAEIQSTLHEQRCVWTKYIWNRCVLQSDWQWEEPGFKSRWQSLYCYLLDNPKLFFEEEEDLCKTFVDLTFPVYLWFHYVSRQIFHKIAFPPKLSAIPLSDDDPCPSPFLGYSSWL